MELDIEDVLTFEESRNDGLYLHYHINGCCVRAAKLPEPNRFEFRVEEIVSGDAYLDRFTIIESGTTKLEIAINLHEVYLRQCLRELRSAVESGTLTVQ